MKYEYIAEANQELADQAEWFENARTGFGARFLDQISKSLDLLVENPSMGKRWRHEPRVRRWPVKSFRLQIIYIVEDDVLRIFALAADRRGPGYWLRRIHERGGS